MSKGTFYTALNFLFSIGALKNENKTVFIAQLDKNKKKHYFCEKFVKLEKMLFKNKVIDLNILRMYSNSCSIDYDFYIMLDVMLEYYKYFRSLEQIKNLTTILRNYYINLNKEFKHKLYYNDEKGKIDFEIRNYANDFIYDTDYKYGGKVPIAYRRIFKFWGSNNKDPQIGKIIDNFYKYTKIKNKVVLKGFKLSEEFEPVSTDNPEERKKLKRKFTSKQYAEKYIQEINWSEWKTVNEANWSARDILGYFFYQYKLKFGGDHVDYAENTEVTKATNLKVGKAFIERNFKKSRQGVKAYVDWAVEKSDSTIYVKKLFSDYFLKEFDKTNISKEIEECNISAEEYLKRLSERL